MTISWGGVVSRGIVESGGIFEDRCVTGVGCDDLEPGLVGCAAAEDLVGQECSGLGRGGFPGEVEHPAGEDVGEFDEVGGHGVAARSIRTGAHNVDALPYFDPV